MVQLVAGTKARVYDKYKVVGFISSGTYGRVYKAQSRDGETKEFAVKKSVVSLASTAKNIDPGAHSIMIGSSQTRRAKSSTLAFHSRLSERWPCVLSLHTRILCIR